MRALLLAVALLHATIGVHAQTVDADSLEVRDSLHYRIGEAEPYSGVAVSSDAAGRPVAEISFKAGVPFGRMRSWYPNGNLQVQGELRGNTKVGLWQAWHANGNLMRQGVFKNGREEGSFSWYSEDGKLSKEGLYRAGVEEGKWVWYHPNGRPMQEGILRGDTSLGVWKEWYPDGRPKMVGSFLNGRKNGTWTWWDGSGNKSRKVYAEDVLTDAPDDVDGHVELMKQRMDHQDLHGAMAYVDSAMALVEDRTEADPRFMWLTIFKAKVLARFQHLEEAQAVLLNATGLAPADVLAIVQAHDSTARPGLRDLAGRLAALLEGDRRIAPHVALALVHNILQDSTAMRTGQQWMMEHAAEEAKDWVLRMSLDLYGLQAAKQRAYGQLAAARSTIEKEGRTRDNELALALHLCDLARYAEALPIAEKYLALNPGDLDFLIVRINMAMGTGDLPGMARYKEAALRIDPHALDE